MKADLVVRNGRVFVNGEFFEGGVAVKDGKTVAICENRYLPEAERSSTPRVILCCREWWILTYMCGTRDTGSGEPSSRRRKQRLPEE